VPSVEDHGARHRYRVHRVRPFFTGGQVRYEVTSSNITDRVNKFDRNTAFTDIEMTDKYAAQLRTLPDSTEVLGHTMPITIIRAWKVLIRPPNRSMACWLLTSAVPSATLIL